MEKEFDLTQLAQYDDPMAAGYCSREDELGQLEKIIAEVIGSRVTVVIRENGTNRPVEEGLWEDIIGMKLVSVDTTLFDKYKNDSEVLTKSKRPYVLVIRLKYKKKNYDFAIPIRSNIPSAAPKDQYFALPPRPTTRPKNRHGLHYIKMFPVTKQYLRRYRTEGRFDLVRT